MSRSVKDVKADGEGLEPTTVQSIEDKLKFDLLRVRAEDVGGCDACGKGHGSGGKFVFCIKAGYPKTINILLCEYHEGELLKRLLRSYLRRMKGVETEGFCGPLPQLLPGDPDPLPNPT